MVSAGQVVVDVSAAAGASVAVGESMRRYWRRRETRQQEAFKAAVQKIVDASITDVISRQADFEHRQGAHLDRQDRDIKAIRRELEKRP